MDYFRKKHGEKPTTPCQYKEKCFRRNPHHFMEYAHEHLENIISNNRGRNEIDDYDVPEELVKKKSIYLIQIKVIKSLFSLPNKRAEHGDEPSEKRVKMEKTKHEQKSSPAAKNLPISAEQLKNALDSILKKPNQTPLKQQSVLDKLEAAKPYRYFLTTIESSPQTHNEPLSISFQEILDPSLGELECSVQINFVVEWDWLFDQYRRANCLNKPLLVLHGSKENPINRISLFQPHVTTHLVEMTNPYATHHTKMMLFGYKDGSMRVIVSTANLLEGDWQNSVQGLWISDRLPLITENSAPLCGDSETKFRSDLITYLMNYNLEHLNSWIGRIRNTDFSSVNVFLVTSIPGTYGNTVNGYAHGLGRVQSLLSQHCESISDATPIVVQCSTFGNLGDEQKGWLKTDFAKSFRCNSETNDSREMPPFQIIYPTFNNVDGSYDGLMGGGGGSLLYDRQRHQNQLWLNNILYEWRADGRYRTRAMPHIKTYARWTGNRLHWFILTSANLSKSAWGWIKSKKQLTIEVSNYEAGVMFLPKFVAQTEYFSMDASDQTTPVFPKLYDIPLTKYGAGDRPYYRDDVGCVIA